MLCSAYSLLGWEWCAIACPLSTVVLLQSNAGGISAKADVEKKQL